MDQSAPETSRARILFVLAVFLALLIAAPVAVASEIEGVVFNAAGEPMAGAAIRIDSAQQSAVSAEDGSFVLRGLASGRYEIQVVATGYAPTSRTVRVRSQEPTRVEFRLRPVVATETVDVTASYSMLGGGSGSGTSMNRQDIDNLPHFGNDLFRAISVLPSASSSDVSSQFRVRGGLGRENLVLVDGLEIFEPFHLKDYEGIFSIIDPGVVGSASLYPGAFSAKYGDRSSAVLDMDTLTPSGRSNSLGVSFSNFWLNSSGQFDGDDGAWVVSVRRGFLDLVFDLAGANDDEGEEQSPAYMDLFGKVSWWLTPRHNVAFNVLVSDDTLDLQVLEDDEDITATTSYGNSYAWLTHRMVPTSRLYAKTVLAFGQLSQDRDAVGAELGDSYTIRDIRDTEVITLKQDWTYELSKGYALDWGFEARSYDTDYDYESTVDIDRAFADPRFRDPSSVIDVNRAVEGEFYSAYVSSRFRPTADLSAEVGLRFSNATWTDESHVAPRVNLRWNSSDKDVFNLGWGHVYQSHRPYELDVQDGESTFFDAERAEHWVLGYERTFDAGWALRAEAYQREIRNPRVRFENLFEPFAQFPEASFDRVRIAATSSTSRGVELLLKAPSKKRFGWWISYVNSEITDAVDGRDQKRRFDQPHALTWNVNYKPSSRWNLNAVWLFHSGWPSTTVTAETVAGPSGTQVVPTVGLFYDDRVSAYHRLDLRASYTKPLRDSRLVFFIDVQNLYGRENPAGFEYGADSFQVQPDGSVLVQPETEEWLGRLPSFGLRWEF